MRTGLLRRMDDTGVPLLLARLALGLEFVLMGWAKAWDPVGFLKLLREYQIAANSTHVVLNVIAVTLPWIELLCGLLLIVGVLIRGASFTLLVLLAGFTVAIIMRALSVHAAEGTPFWSVHFDCGCGGGDVNMYRKIPENIALWLLCWAALLSRSRRFCLAGRFAPSSHRTGAEISTEVV